MVVACSQWIGEIRLLFFITFGILGTKFLSHFIAAARLKSSNYANAKYQDDGHLLLKISIYIPKNCLLKISEAHRDKFRHLFEWP